MSDPQTIRSWCAPLVIVREIRRRRTDVVVVVGLVSTEPTSGSEPTLTGQCSTPHHWDWRGDRGQQQGEKSKDGKVTRGDKRERRGNDEASHIHSLGLTAREAGLKLFVASDAV